MKIEQDRHVPLVGVAIAAGASEVYICLGTFAVGRGLQVVPSETIMHFGVYLGGAATIDAWILLHKTTIRWTIDPDIFGFDKENVAEAR